MVNPSQFARSLMNRNACMELREFMEKSIDIVLSEDLNQSKFRDMLELFNSFEGIEDTFCINLQAAWFKYASGDKNTKSTYLRNKILGDEWTQHETDQDTTHNIKNDMYRKINWLDSDILGEPVEDPSVDRKYIIVKCKKYQASNKSYQPVNMIIMRPRDFIDLMTSSRCVSEYRKYFITIAEIYRAFQSTYLPWLLKLYRSEKMSLTEKVDAQSNQIRELIAHTKHIANQSDLILSENKAQSKQLTEIQNTLDNMFEYIKTFAKATLTAWMGPSIFHQQCTTVGRNNGNPLTTMSRTKSLFFIAFWRPYGRKISGKSKDGTTTSFNSHMKVYACCTNLGNFNAALQKLHDRHNNRDAANRAHPYMYMLEPTTINLFSVEVNQERAVLAGLDVFSNDTNATWEGTYKRFNVQCNADSIVDAHNEFKLICDRVKQTRFQGYQQRIDQFNKNGGNVMDPKIVNYINMVDQEFYDSSRDKLQDYVSNHTYEAYYDKKHTMTKWRYGTQYDEACEREEYNNVVLSGADYALHQLNDLIIQYGSRDYAHDMTDKGILSKEHIPMLQDIAKFENIDVEALGIPDDL